jgi:hypothetical protein
MELETLNECIDSLRGRVDKQKKFSNLKQKIRDRFELQFTVDIGKIGEIKAGFDNHRNHQRPHIHLNKFGERISVAIDSGELLHENKKIKEKDLTAIKLWVLSKRKCLKFIYDNIQNCKSKEDFQPLINAINKYLN